MPLRGQKTTYWEGGVKSAGFVAGAGVPVSGSTAALVHVTDIYPSLLAYAARGIGGGAAAAAAASGPGGEPDDQPPFTLGDGIEQWRTMVNHPDRPAEDPRTEILHVVHLDSERGPAVLRQGDYKLLADTNTWDGTTLSGSISTILIVLSWGFVSIHTCGALPSPVCALNWPI